MLALLLLATTLTAAEVPSDWWQGDHLTGDWGGARTTLAEHGLTLDLIYAVEVIANTAASGDGVSLQGHVDLGVTVDLEKLGAWPGGRVYLLGQNGHGTGINASVGSATSVSNIEAPPYTQLAEFFLEQSLLEDRLRFRLGKQDANRDFGTPRFGGNFLNNNFGMFPSDSLPSYPTTGLGAAVIARPLAWLTVKGAFYEGSPRVGSFGFDSAFAPGAGWTAVGALGATHQLGEEGRSQGTTSAGVFGQSGHFDELAPAGPMPRTFTSNLGVFVQDDERLYAHPGDASDGSGLTCITRFGWSRPDRNNIALYLGASLAWHGLGARSDDTVGLGFGWFSVARQANGTVGPGSEVFVEAFYKWRMTHFLSLQPDVEYYRHPGGDRRDALLVGVRLKLKV